MWKRRATNPGEERLAKNSSSTGSGRRIRLKSRKTKPQNRLGVMLCNPSGGSLIETKPAHRARRLAPKPVEENRP